jgi:hypothetical protein
MLRSGKFWLVFAAFVGAALVGLRLPIGETPFPAGLVIILAGAVGAVAFKRRDPVIAAGLTWGVVAYLVAFGVLVAWTMTHLTLP